jgi:hypothetical protein
MYMPEPSESLTDFRDMAFSADPETRMLLYFTRSDHAASSSGRGGPRYGFRRVRSSSKRTLS